MLTVPLTEENVLSVARPPRRHPLLLPEGAGPRSVVPPGIPRLPQFSDGQERRPAGAALEDEQEVDLHARPLLQRGVRPGGRLGQALPRPHRVAKTQVSLNFDPICINSNSNAHIFSSVITKSANRSVHV